jgi:hypothetical protein
MTTLAAFQPAIGEDPIFPRLFSRHFAPPPPAHRSQADCETNNARLTAHRGESYFAPAGALECVAPAVGVNWAAAQEGAKATCFHVFVLFLRFFPAFFTGWFFAIFIWFQLFLSLLEFELF